MIIWIALSRQLTNVAFVFNYCHPTWALDSTVINILPDYACETGTSPHTYAGRAHFAVAYILFPELLASRLGGTDPSRDLGHWRFSSSEYTISAAINNPPA